MKNLSSINSKLIEELHSSSVKFSVPLRNYTYTKLGGKADVFLTPSCYEEVRVILQIANQYDVPITLIGNGTNLIVKDSGIEGIVISLHQLNKISVETQMITAQAGANIADVSKRALKEELSGLEFACGIPGTVGGALYMNAGAYGGQISDVLKRAVVITEKGEILTLEKDDLQLGYRKSIISKKGYMVLEAQFELHHADYKSIKAKVDENTRLREEKQPLEYPSCGSVFKRPPGHFAGKLIQDAGLQGLRIGDAEVSTKHAGFIVNLGHATAKDYTDLIKIIQKTVKEKFDVDLETEVIVLGKGD